MAKKMRRKNLTVTIFLSISVLFLCQTAIASPLSYVRWDFAVGNYPTSVATGDLDLSVADKNVSVLLNNGDDTQRHSIIKSGRKCVPKTVSGIESLKIRAARILA